MGKTADKIVDLQYNETITLRVIEQDSDLTKIFREDVELPFLMLYKLSKERLLNKEHAELVKGIFNHVILCKKEFAGKYLQIAKENDVNVMLANDNKVEEVVESPVIEEEVKPVKIKKEKELPRRYGKEKIVADIEKQGGKATPLQHAMLKTNSLKNIYVNINARAIKDMFSGTNLLSEADCREIVSAVTIVERKLEAILKRKK